MTRAPLRPAIDEAVQTLHAAGVPSPRNDAEQLAAHVLSVDRARLLLAPLLTREQLDEFRAVVARRAQRIPLQHLLGHAAMGELELEVGPGVFVPRPETELVFAWAVAQLAAMSLEHAPLVVDLCTGSGALALAVAHARPDAHVYAVELDPDALWWARRNADLRAAAGDTAIVVYADDVTEPAALAPLYGRVDLVLANPPYLPDDAQLEPEVAEHDPVVALFAGPDGLDVIRPMVSVIARLLRPAGATAIEHDDGNGARVAELLAAAGSFTDIAEHPDLAGKPRFVTAVRSTGGAVAHD